MRRRLAGPVWSSMCHRAPVWVMGEPWETQYWECLVCGQPCEAMKVLGEVSHVAR